MRRALVVLARLGVGCAGLLGLDEVRYRIGADGGILDATTHDRAAGASGTTDGAAPSPDGGTCERLDDAGEYRIDFNADAAVPGSLTEPDGTLGIEQGALRATPPGPIDANDRQVNTSFGFAVVAREVTVDVNPLSDCDATSFQVRVDRIEIAWTQTPRRC